MILISVRAPPHGGSEYHRAARSIGLLAVVALGYLVALEIAARILLPTHSELVARIRSDWNTALKVRKSPSGDPRSFLVVGNSLLLLAIDRKEFGVLQQGSTLSVAIMPIENTNYLDWYFGIRRLLAEGSRPEFAVLCLAPAQLISRNTNGVEFARTLMQPADILRVKQAAGLDWTTTSTYLLASASAWIGYGTGIRNWIRVETLPWMTELAPYFRQRVPANPRADFIEKIVARRLTQFSDTCTAHGCKGLLVIPPLVRDPGDESLAAIVRAGHAAGVPVVVPTAPGELGPGFFSDGFHLNQRGAEVFTRRLLEALEGIPDNATVPPRRTVKPDSPN